MTMRLNWVRRTGAWISGLLEERPRNELPSQGHFLRMLQRERARADRSESQFSLLALGVDRSTRGRATFRHLVTLLNRRLRITDDVGWLDGRHIGVILPDTPSWGAWALVDDLCLAFPTDIPLFECKVYVYPDDGSSSNDDDTGRSTWRVPVLEGQHASRRRSKDSRGSPDTTSVVPRPPTGETSYCRTAEAMDPLFIERLPAWKRSLDVAGATFAIILLAPAILMIAVLIRLSGRGPVLFVQWRRGLGGRPFPLYKFRTMVVDAEARKSEVMALNEQDGPAFKIGKDPRVTAMGRWLRKTSLDELPQLWNVLRGDMSLVGPRPLPVAEADACHGWHRHRVDVTPGITCFWQVRTSPTVPFVDWMRMDTRYLRCRSLTGDLVLLLRTLPAVVLRRNR
jgi:lipopolysaccharide/colanic/teichoic acid biosynthesis glycosyltransferase